MCGVLGLIDFGARSGADELAELATRMAITLAHRGPDDSGVWVDERAGVALGHRRLSILDLSAAGHQPMISGNGRWVLSFNGEIYNFRTLRRDLELHGHTFRGTSDTEVLVESIARWGFADALPRLNGMFAIAAYDRHARVLWLARDRFGEKPMYYGWFGGVLLFGSQLRALRAHPCFDSELDRAAIATYFLRNCIPAPWTIYRRALKLPPGSWLRVPLSSSQNTDPVRYWDALHVAENAAAAPFTGTYTEATTELTTLLSDAVDIRMESDVPLGAFLSGGIDSTVVTALMQQRSSKPVRTFTVGYAQVNYDESNYAREVAKHLGTDHTQLTVTDAEACDAVLDLPGVYDEPFADSSQLPTLLLSRLTRDNVTVALSGDGGDEVFGGYNRYLWVERLQRHAQRYPLALRRGGQRLADRIPPATWEQIARVAPSRLRTLAHSSNATKMAAVVAAESHADAYLRLISHWSRPPVLSGQAYRGTLESVEKWPRLGSATEQMMALDAVSYLPDDILVKVDRASMAYGLEVRVPILDYRVFEFAWHLPLHMRVSEGSSKRVLRSIAYAQVPAALLDRPKMGFGTPIGTWLRGPLRDWADDLLSVSRLREDGLLNATVVREAWQRHRSGRQDLQHQLWDVLMLQAWLQTNGATP